MAAPKWWQIEPIQAKRQREREVLDVVTRDVGSFLAKGDVAGARRALADAAPNPNVPAAQKYSRDLASSLRKRFTPFELHEPGTGPNDNKKDGGGNRFLNAAKKAGVAANFVNPHTMVPATLGALADKTGLTDRVSEKTPEPVRNAASFGAALNAPAATALGAIAGEKESRANVARFFSGERLGNDLGLPATEALDKLREKGFVGRVAATAIDQATAPATYAGGVGIGQGFAQGVGKSLARRWAQEVGAATVGTLAGQMTAEQLAKRTDNPYVVGGAGIAAGLLAGGAAYNPAATARVGARAGRSVGADIKAIAQEPGAALREFHGAEAGQSEVIPRGRRVFHGTSADFPDEEVAASKYGALGKGVYVDATDPEAAPLGGHFAMRQAIGTSGKSADETIDWVAGGGDGGVQHWATGARILDLTPTRDAVGLLEDQPILPKELKAIRQALSPDERAKFNTALAKNAPKGEKALGGDVRFALSLVNDEMDFPERILQKAGFDAMGGDNISKWGTREFNIFDPKLLQSHTSYRAEQAALPKFDPEAARAVAQKYIDNARVVNGVPVGLPPGVKTADDVVKLQEAVFNMAVEGRGGRFWYERSGKAILKMFGGDTRKANQFSQLIAAYSPSREILPNFDLALRAWSQWQAGDPITVGSRQQWKTATKIMQGIPWEGRKTSNFYGNMLAYIDPNHPDVEELKNAVTVDRHQGTAYGFPVVKQNKASRSSSSSGSVAIGKGPRYDFVEQQTQELARQLGWTPEQTQAAIWVVEKAKKSKGRMNVEQASFDFADSLEQSWAQVSWEAAPGLNTGFMPGYHNAGPMEQMEWFKAIDEAFMDEDGLDILAKEMLGGGTPGESHVTGVFRNSAGELETNPSGQTLVAAPPALKSTSVSMLEPKPEGMTINIARGEQKGTYEVKPGALGPVIDKHGGFLSEGFTIPGNEYAIEPAAVNRINAYAAARAMLLHQESVAWTKPIAVKSAAEGNGIAVSVGRTLSADETRQLAESLGEDVFIVGTDRGAWFLNADWSGVDNVSFHNLVKKAVGDIVPEDNTVKVFRNGGGYIEGGPDGQNYLRIIDEAGGRGAFERASAVLQPRLEAVARDFDERYGWASGGTPAAGRGFADAAGQVDAGLAANLATGAAGAAYGYATGDDTQDRWKRALAFGVGGFAGGAAAQAGARLLNPSVLPTTAPPRPASVLSALPPTSNENRYINASGLERVIPKLGTARAQAAVAAKLEALKTPGRVTEALPPVVRNGVALLNPSINQDQQVLAAWRAGKAVTAQLRTAWTAKLAPVVDRVETLLPTATYHGPRGTAADVLIGTAKDIAENPELYDISPELRTALDDLNVAMWDEVAGQARADYGIDVLPFEADGKPGFVWLPTVASADSVDDKIDSAFASLSTKSGAKRRGYDTARDRLMNANPRATAAGAPEFVPETDLRELVSTAIQSMSSNAGHATFKEGGGGRKLADVIDELHPGLAQRKTKARQMVTNLNAQVKTATRAKADTLKRIGLNDTQLRAIDKRMQPLENRIAALEAENEFGPELSYLSGQVRELRMMRGKLATYGQTLEGRKGFSEKRLLALDSAIDVAQDELESVVRSYESAGTAPYVRDQRTMRWYTPEQAKTIAQLQSVPSGFGKTLADMSDEIRAWHLAGDASLGTIQGGLGVMSDPIAAAKTARLMIGKNPTAELARIAQAEADDVAEYTFATGRSFGEPLAEMRLQKRGFERVPGINKAQDQLTALFERGSYEAWKRERDIILAQNPDMSRSLAGHEAANMLSKVVPGLNPAERGVSGTRAAIERGALTSVSFATSPALLGAEAAKGTAELARQAALKLMRSPSVNPDGAWASLTAREQVAIRRTVGLAATVTALSVASAIISAPSRNLSVEDAVKETFDPNSRYFAALQLGDGRSIPLGGPFRSAIKAIVPNKDGVYFGNLPSWAGSRINSPIKPVVDIARNKDFFGDPIYQGNVARPENALRAIWYAAEQGGLPVSAGALSEDVRKGQLDVTGTPTRVAAQFLGTNLSPVSPTEKLNQLSRARYQKDFYDLLPSERETIKKASPALWNEAVARGSDARRQAEAQKAKLREAQQADDDLFLQGKLTLDKWTQSTDDRSNQLVGAEDVLYADAKGQASKSVSPVLDAYYQQIDASAKANNGRVDWDVIDAWKATLSKSDQKLIEQNTGLNKTPLVKLKQDLSKQYYSLPRYRGYTSDQAYEIDALWQEVRNAARGPDDAQMLAAMRKNPSLTQGVDPVIVQGVKRRIVGLLHEDNSRANWAKAHPESAVFLRRGKLTAADSAAIRKAMRGTAS